MSVTASDLVMKFAPDAKPAYINTFEAVPDRLVGAWIITPLRVAYMAQILHETGDTCRAIFAYRTQKNGLVASNRITSDLVQSLGL